MPYRPPMTFFGVAAIVWIASAASMISVARAGTVIAASGDTSQPSQTSNYFLGANSTFFISEGVQLSGAGGPWIKQLNNGSGATFADGANLQINETLTNVGASAWGGWHEAITSRTTIQSTNDSPGFLFRQGSIVLTVDRGSGFVPLTAGVDYSVSTLAYSGPSNAGNNGNWEAIDISFAPAAAIQTFQTLRIRKQIFEVFGDADAWTTGTAAGVAQYPTAVPEPTVSMLGIVTALGLVARHRKPA